MDDFDLTERLTTPAEFTSMLGVTEDDALEWGLAGHVPYVEGPEREPPVRISENIASTGGSRPDSPAIRSAAIPGPS
jgi:hypothetical protein